jgi:hypothetical protein
VLDSLDNTKTAGTETGNVQLNIQPRAFDKIRPTVRLGWQERMRDACLKNIEPVRALIECQGATEATLNTVSRRVEGVTLRCPSSGTYKYDADRQITYCTAHGDNDHPRQPREAAENEGLLEFIDRMTDFSLNFRFTKEGIMTKIAFNLEPEPPAGKKGK